MSIESSSSAKRGRTEYESKAEATHDQSPSPQAPWLGLRSYDEAARGYFYGREREVQELYQSVCEHRLSVLFGRSGLGKTSLLRAGLLPRLRAEGRLGVLIRLRFDDEAATLVRQVREALHAVLRPELESDAELAADLLERPLWQLAHQAQTQSALEFLRPVLIFDQFEEVFSLGAGSDDEKRKRRDRRSEVETLLFELADLIEDREPASLRERLRSERDFAAEFSRGEHPLRVLITLREDYLHQLERWRRTLPSLMRQRIELLALRGPEALDVVLKPARKRALPLLETDVAERIVRIAAKAKADTPIDWIEAVPPLLSQLCFELNEMRLKRGGDSDTSQIEATDVQQDAANVLKHYYQRCLHGRPKGVAQAIEFLLIDDGGRIREASSQDTVLSQMRGYGVEQPEHELEQLIDLRLLTREERGGAPRIELTHDSLVEVVAEARNAREAEEREEAEQLKVAERDRLAAINSILRIAARRALGRARERRANADLTACAAYTAEALSYSKEYSRDAAAILMQQLHSCIFLRFVLPIPAVSLSSSREETRAVTIHEDGTARIWNAQSGTALGVLPRQNNRFLSATISTDGSHIVTINSDREAQVWDAESADSVGKPITAIHFAAFSPSGARLLTAGGDDTGIGRSVKFWEARTGETLEMKLEHEKHVYYAAFSPDGKKVVTASSDGIARVWFNLTSSIALRHKDKVLSACFSPEGARVVTVSGKTVQVWDAESGLTVGDALQHAENVNSVAFSPDGRRLATTTVGGFAQVWDAFNSIIAGPPLYDSSINSAHFSAAGAQLITVSLSCEPRLWLVSAAAARGVAARSEDVVLSSRFNSDGTQISTIVLPKANEQFFAETAKAFTVGNWFEFHDGPLPRIAKLSWISPISQNVLFVSRKGMKARHITWLDLAIALLNQRATVLYDTIEAIKRAKAEETFGASPRELPEELDNLIINRKLVLKQMWNAKSGMILDATPEEENWSLPKAFRKHGKHVLVCDRNTAEMQDISSQEALGIIRQDQEIYDSAFSPDGTRVVTASSDGTARIWDVQTAEMLGASVTADDLIALSGRRVADNGQLEWLPGPEWMALIKKVKAEAEQGTTKKDQLMRWHFADPATRTISPFSEITVPQHIEREIDWVLEHPQTEEPSGPNYSPRILDDAYNLDPGHPLILLALSVFEDRPETKALWKRLSFPRFEKDARLAARAAEILLIDKDPENARKAAELALNLPTATEADKAKAQAVLAQIDAQP